MAALSLLLLLPSCVIATERTPYDGEVVFDWTIDGTTDPAECTATGASMFSVTVYDDRDRLVGTFDAQCSAFATSLVLDQGTYSADAVLIDNAGRSRTTTVQVIPFRILRGTSLDVPLDFPLRAFY